MLAKLRHRVEECRDLTSEMTSQKTESASVRITRSGTLRDKLGEAANLCTSLAVHLDGKGICTKLSNLESLSSLVICQGTGFRSIHRVKLNYRHGSSLQFKNSSSTPLRTTRWRHYRVDCPMVSSNPLVCKARGS